MVRVSKGYQPAALMIAAALLAVVASPVLSAVYVYKDKAGVVHLTDKPGRFDRPNQHKYRRVVGRGWLNPPNATWSNWKQFKQNRKRYGSIVNKAALRYRVDEALLHAIITAESAFDPNAVSRTGAVGLMQLMPATAQRYGVRNRRDPASNVYGGTAYFRDLLKRFNNLSLALAAYNAGEGAVIKSGNRVPPYRETRNYVSKVLKYYDHYRKNM